MGMSVVVLVKVVICVCIIINVSNIVRVKVFFFELKLLVMVRIIGFVIISLMELVSVVGKLIMLCLRWLVSLFLNMVNFFIIIIIINYCFGIMFIYGRYYI